jgi:alkylation response protein AidB-like acyl-CoA dehydrogenase
MTEPGTGSDLQNIRSTAKPNGNGYIVSGQKTFISNGQNAGAVIAAVKTDPNRGAKGVSLIVIEDGMPGFERGRNLRKMGNKDQDTSELFFNDVKAPAENLLGGEGQGFALMMQELPQERIAIAVSAVAAAQKAYDITLDYVRERQAFGKAIADFQNTRYTLAGLKTELAAGWAFLDECLAEHLQGRLSVTRAAMAKLWCTEMQGRVTDACVQLFGGYGYMDEYEISRLYTAARVQRIYGGTSEIMKELIARDL